MSPDFQDHILLKTVRLLDLAAVCVVFLTSLTVSSGSFSQADLAEVLVIRIKVANLLLFMGYLAFCSAVFVACGVYRSHRLSRWPGRFYEIFLAATLLAGVLWLLRWPLALAFATDAFLLLFWLLMLCALILSHESARWLLHLARLRGRNQHNVIVVGEEPHATALANRMRQEVSLGYRVLRVIDAAEIIKNTGLADDS
jgi:FlaA1/EpsC-like NDP-sugar epimerase